MKLIKNGSNCDIIKANGCEFLMSYGAVIVKINPCGKVFLDSYYWAYSRTTGKHRNDFLGETINETRAKIKSREYKLANLNR